jgi:hypothetical protein
MQLVLQGNSHAGGVEVYSDFSDSDPETEDMDREAADQYRATRKARRIMASSRRSPDSDEFGPVGKGGSVYSHHSQGGSMLGKESIFDEADGLLAKVLKRLYQFASMVQRTYSVAF